VYPPKDRKPAGDGTGNGAEREPADQGPAQFPAVEPDSRAVAGKLGEGEHRDRGGQSEQDGEDRQQQDTTAESVLGIG
jgi:hypothetical protein